MRTTLIAVAALIFLAPAIALADGVDTASAVPTAQVDGTWFAGFGATYDFVDMPNHGDGVMQLNFGSGLKPMFAQADAEGWGYGGTLGTDSASGWRFAASGGWLNADGTDQRTFSIPNLTPFRHGRLNGTTVASGNYGGTHSAVQDLDVDLSDWSLAASAGKVLMQSPGNILRADISVSYDQSQSDYENVVHAAGETYRTNTGFDVGTTAFAVRLSDAIVANNWFWVGFGGTVGFAFKNIDMDASDLFINGGGSHSSSLSISDTDTGYIARLDASLNFQVSSSITVAVTGGLSFDAKVPVYVAPDYLTSSAASFDTEDHTSASVGAHLIGRW